jgi:methylated-DNA-[protein]-cysteine S-methyltransferase
MKPDRPPTEFEQAVYQIVRNIPAGKVTTYGNIAKRLQRGSARSVGTALARNPFAPEVPCHRVVRANGNLGGFHGETEGPRLDEKQRLLESEGVSFPSTHRASPAAILPL